MENVEFNSSLRSIDKIQSRFGVKTASTVCLFDNFGSWIVINLSNDRNRRRLFSTDSFISWFENETNVRRTNFEWNSCLYWQRLVSISIAFSFAIEVCLFLCLNENQIQKFRCELSFIRSEFRGQLPKAYSQLKNATRLVENHFNDENKEEIDRYVCLFVFSFFKKEIESIDLFVN